MTMHAVQDVISTTSTVRRENEDRVEHGDLEGQIVSGSYNEADGTVKVLLCDTYAVFTDSGDQYVQVSAKLKAPAFGMQYGAVGGERVKLSRTQSGYAAEITYEEDDSPGVPSGELHYLHAKPETVGEAGVPPTTDTGLAFTNDGSNTNDGLGGAHLGGEGDLTRIVVDSGSSNYHVIELSKTNKTIKITSAGGHKVTVDDGATTSGITAQTVGGLISHLDDVHAQINHIAGKIGMGDTWTNLNLVTGSAAMRNLDITTFENSLHTQRLTDLENLATAVAGALLGASPPVTISASAIIALIASLAHITVPSGAATTLVK